MNRKHGYYPLCNKILLCNIRWACGVRRASSLYLFSLKDHISYLHSTSRNKQPFSVIFFLSSLHAARNSRNRVDALYAALPTNMVVFHFTTLPLTQAT